MVQGLGEFATAGASHPPALMLGYARPPRHAYPGSLDRLDAALHELTR